jgi:hypothetical protein
MNQDQNTRSISAAAQAIVGKLNGASIRCVQVKPGAGAIDFAEVFSAEVLADVEFAGVLAPLIDAGEGDLIVTGQHAANLTALARAATGEVPGNPKADAWFEDHQQRACRALNENLEVIRAIAKRLEAGAVLNDSDIAAALKH